MNAQLTTVEAFQAMVKFLEKYYKFTKADDIGALLGGMDQGFWDNESTFDPALWKDGGVSECGIKRKVLIIRRLAR